MRRHENLLGNTLHEIAVLLLGASPNAQSLAADRNSRLCLARHRGVAPARARTSHGPRVAS